jgi:hypothetical protein
MNGAGVPGAAFELRTGGKRHPVSTPGFKETLYNGCP